MSNEPGQIELTRIGASSTAIARANDSTAAVAAAPAERLARGRNAETPEQNVNDPVGGIRGAPAAHRLRAAHTRASIARWYISWLVSATLAFGCSPVNDATWSMRSYVSNSACTASGVCSVERLRPRVTADLSQGLVESLPVAGDDRDVGARRPCCPRRGQAEARAGAEQHDGLSLERDRHASCPPSQASGQSKSVTAVHAPRSASQRIVRAGAEPPVLAAPERHVGAAGHRHGAQLLEAGHQRSAFGVGPGTPQALDQQRHEVARDEHVRPLPGRHRVSRRVRRPLASVRTPRARGRSQLRVGVPAATSPTRLIVSASVPS